MARVREATRGEILRAAQKDATYLEQVESKVRCFDLNATLHANLARKEHKDIIIIIIDIILINYHHHRQGKLFGGQLVGSNLVGSMAEMAGTSNIVPLLLPHHLALLPDPGRGVHRGGPGDH